MFHLLFAHRGESLLALECDPPHAGDPGEREPEQAPDPDWIYESRIEREVEQEMKEGRSDEPGRSQSVVSGRHSSLVSEPGTCRIDVVGVPTGAILERSVLVAIGVASSLRYRGLFRLEGNEPTALAGLGTDR